MSKSKLFGLMALIAIAACERANDGEADAAADTTAAGPVVAGDSMTISGFSTPESVLYDAAGDVYFVSNINGGGIEKDDNGFISKITPDGMVTLKFIDGAAENVSLHGPKGLAIIGDTLFVSDIDSVRAFNRNDGAPIGARGVPGASFLNDLVAANGVLYVTDTGVNADFSSNGKEAIYRFENGKPVAHAKGADKFKGPNGLAADGENLIVVPFGSATVSRVGKDGSVTKVVDTPKGGLDGIEKANDGGWLVSSWEGKAIYHIDAQGAVHSSMENIDSPADIGYDTKRGRVLVPSFNGNRVEIRKR